MKLVAVGILILIAHVLSDFYLQTDKIAEKKKECTIYLFIHMIILFCVTTICMISFLDIKLFIFTIAYAFIHGLIDYTKIALSKKNRTDEKDVKLFVLDQIVHIITIVIFMILFELNVGFVYAPKLFLFGSENYGIVIRALSRVLMFLIIIKPASIAIRLIMESFKLPQTEEESNEEMSGLPNAGSHIGSLERVFILFMMILNQYSAIGFVLTAKSIARYKKITDSAQFGEYYLLGTLLSAVIASGTYLLIDRLVRGLMVIL